MEINRISDEVFYAKGEIITLGSEDLAFLQAQAARNPRKRARLCAHIDASDRLHEMFIVNLRDTYVRPHKNANKPKSFQILEGLIDVVIFDDSGTVQSAMRLGAYASGFPSYFRLHETRYHTLRTISDIVLFHETTIGPFQPGDTIFAPWAPDDGQQECASFLRQIDLAVARLMPIKPPIR
jgi:cupin fold WbuC family metalloprotein